MRAVKVERLVQYRGLDSSSFEEELENMVEGINFGEIDEENVHV